MAPRRTWVTRALLVGGVIAGPMFVTVMAVQEVTREGFDPGRHPISAFSLGERGWIQIGNFVVVGALSLAFAVGMRRVLHPGLGATWVPLLVGGYGSGLIVAGLFVGDPGLGFPPGTAEEIPEHAMGHAMVHAVGPPMAFAAVIAVCSVLARRFLVVGRRGWAVYCLVTAIAAPALLAWPGAGGAVRTAIAVVVTSARMTAVAIELATELSRSVAVGEAT